MSSLRCVLFGMLNKRSNFVKHVKTKFHQPLTFIHTSRIFFNGQTIEIKMPSLSPTMTEGTIVKWLKKEGDTISPGDVLCEIQTDKAVVGLEVEEEGTLAKILIPEDTKNVQLGEVIAILADGDVDISQIKVESKARSVKEETFTPPPIVQKIDTPRLFGPSVKKLLQEYGIKYSDVSGSGPHNILLKGDVLSYIKDKSLKQIQITAKMPDLPSVRRDVPAGKPTGKKSSHVDIPVSNDKRSIAQQLIHSKSTKPHVYMNIDCKINKVFDYEKKLKLDGIDISLNEFIIKSAAVALRKVPQLNMIHQDGQVKALNSIDIAMSFVDDSNYVTPVVKNADKLTIDVISKIVNSSIEAAKENKLQQDNLSATSFKICNLGAFGVSEFSAVIYPPQVATLAIGTVRSLFEEQVPSQRVKATLSFDSAIVTETEASSFLNFFKQCLENPLNASVLS